MKQNQKTTLLVATLVFAILFICGLIGFIGDQGRHATSTEKTQAAQSANHPAISELGYCSETTRLCVIAFGYDNAENMLITVRNSLATLPEVFIKIKQTDSEKLYECQKVEFSSDTFYCLGDQIPPEAQVTLEIYSKNTGNLTASGNLTIHFEVGARVSSTKPGSTATIIAIKTPTPAYPNDDPAQTLETPTQAYP